METFSFPYATVGVDYPESSVRVKFGNAYEFASKPSAPDQRIFTLTFEAMLYMTTPADWDDLDLDWDLWEEVWDWAGSFSETASPADINLYRLEQFYQRHRLYEPFLYNHPVYGELTVRFSQPLRIPAGQKGGGGMHGPIEIKLVELP